MRNRPKSKPDNRISAVNKRYAEFGQEVEVCKLIHTCVQKYRHLEENVEKWDKILAEVKVKITEQFKIGLDNQ